MSQQEIAAIRLALSALFLTFLIIASLLASIISSRNGSSSPQQHHGGNSHQHSDMLDALAEAARQSFSDAWAYYAPYYPAAPFDNSTRKGCIVSQVNILQRHGARYPTSGLTIPITAALTKLQSVASYKDAKSDFLKSYTYDLGEDDLVQYGSDQSSSLGMETFQRYKHLVVGTNALPFIRASGSERVIRSAQSWAEGFSSAGGGAYPTKVNLIIPETRGSNNTLDDGTCPAAVNTEAQAKGFVDIAAGNTAARLNSGAPGANLTAQDAYAIMHMCPFDTVAKESVSPFCDLFPEEDFKIYEYAGDLNKFYNTGYGGPLGAVQGVGYINELIARLTNSPVHHGLQTNSTLISSLETFPFNRTIYADFSHDNLIIAVFTAMGLFNQTSGPLDRTKIAEDRTWITSKMIPFSGHLTVERLSCPVHPTDTDSEKLRGWVIRRDDDEGGAREEYVRVFVNDARQPLHFCGALGDGMCRLEEFVRSQEYARNDGFGDFAACAYTGGSKRNIFP